MSKTKIEWTDATWNPIVGCSVVSPGCTNCYAMRMAARLESMARRRPAASTGTDHYVGLTERTNAGPVWTGRVAMAPDRIVERPLGWRRRRMVFVNSMGDLFHDAVTDEWIDRVFAVMAMTPQHYFQVLTKRAVRMRSYLTDRTREALIGREAARLHLERGGEPPLEWAGLPLPNVWLGVSVEDQRRADERIPDLLQTPAAIRFVSAEPLLGPVDLTNIKPPERYEVDALTGYDFDQGTVGDCLDWVICGGESGPGARPMHPDWARSIRDQCLHSGVPFFFKQMARKAPIPADLMIRELPARNT